MENTTLTEENISELNRDDYHALNDFSQELTLTNEDMETEVIVENQEIIEHEEEVETEETVADDFVETDQHTASSDEILQGLKNIRPILGTNAIPPLRPLTIAPKPAKVPLTVKPVAGQQLLLLQGSGAGQTLKLVSPQGQELNLANLISSRPVAIKPTFKTVSSPGGNISIIQQKPLVMKKVMTPAQKAVAAKPTLTAFTNKQGQHFMLVQKSGDQQQLKLVQAQGGSLTTVPSPTKTITLQQAQEMGLIGNSTKLVQQSAGTAKQQTLLLAKAPQKGVKLVPQMTPTLVSAAVPSTSVTKTQSTVKTPTKILPAGAVTLPKGSQKIFFKTTGTNQTIIPSGQLIQVASSQALASGQLHQINIPGKGMQLIKFVTASTAEATIPTTSTGTTTAAKLVTNVPTSNMIVTEIKAASTASKIAPKPAKTITSTVTAAAPQVLAVLPATAYPATIAPVAKVAIPPNPSPRQAQVKPSPPKSATPPPATPPMSKTEDLDANGMRPRKPCNCTKSQCLKLYCDCFANGEFCYMCKCINCFNDLDNEEYRNRAIKACLERNPHAFKPKIGKAKDVAGDTAIRKHTKGCNCKRSGCLKNYCECYEAKIACSNNCKCIGCRNIEDSMEKKTLRHLVEMEKVAAAIMSANRYSPTRDGNRQRRSSNTRNKQTVNYITEEVIEATCQCMLTICDNAQENMQDEEMTKRLIIEEFGRCLTEIIDCTSNHT
ncbi:unnamed protein product [Acanthoscelides obtectus]|nr:unnamed protein product [Acanthoscelides obtectus]CAK1638168.1 Protein lin-54 homolog [Acanthoscelides obtectus]